MRRLRSLHGLGALVWTLGTFGNPVDGVAQSVAVASTESRATSDVMATPVTVILDRVAVKAAIERLAASANVRISYLGRQLDAIATPITLHARKMPLGLALNRVLDGTGLRAVPVKSDLVNVEVGAAVAIVDGVITGTVIDSKTRQPLRGVTVALAGIARGARTNDDGRFRIVSVSPGEYSVTVRLLGYGKQIKRVTVGNGESVTLDVGLEPSLNALDQVVVTGTVVATERKAIPNAMTVITAKQIEERGITRIDQLFRGDVPGLFAANMGSELRSGEVVMFSRGASTIAQNNTNQIKTFVDGVEVSSLPFIDPRSIERIEILTGPQASTIYGSNALNGVMQVFTKRGATQRPQVTLEFMNGWVQSDFSNALTPQHDYSLQATGSEGRISYNAGGSWNYLGPWTPARRNSRVNTYGGARLAMPTPAGMLTTDLQIRRNFSTDKKSGRSDQQEAYFHETGWYNGPTYMWGNAPATARSGNDVLGVTVGYAPTSWWSHEATIGREANDNYNNEGKLYSSAQFPDTLGNYNASQSQRRSLRYTTTANIPLTRFAQGLVTLGADTWQYAITYTWGQSSRAMSVGRYSDHNTGGFLQTQLGILDHLFFTYGVRAEWNPAFGEEALPTYSPRYGVAYSTDIGPITAKARASYGRSTRPPFRGAKLAEVEDDAERVAIYGPHNKQIANPALGPEYQQGGEGGVEFYFGNRASLVVTRYNQTVEGIEARVLGADSVKSLNPNPVFWGSLPCSRMIQFKVFESCHSQDDEGYTYGLLWQKINGASIRNQGWELQGNTVFGPLTARATYSWTKSRVIGVTERYRATMAAIGYNQYRPGDIFNLLAEHTAAVGLTYSRATTNIGLNVTRIGPVRTYSTKFGMEHLDGQIRLWQDRLIFNDRAARSYAEMNPGYVQADLNVSHRLLPRVETLLQVLNLTNKYQSDANPRGAVMGRVTKVGVRIR